MVMVGTAIIEIFVVVFIVVFVVLSKTPTTVTKTTTTASSKTTIEERSILEIIHQFSLKGMVVLVVDGFGNFNIDTLTLIPSDDNIYPTNSISLWKNLHLFVD
ncbi:hypothetical protein ACTA71_007320 [Dictyostelium dimigraforme]